MNKTSIQIQRKLDRVVILRPEEIARKKIKVKKVYAPLPHEPIEILRSERIEAKPKFFQEFSFSDGELVQIEIDRAVQSGPSVEEISGKVQKSYDQGFQDGQEITRATMQVEIEKGLDMARQIDGISLELRREFSKILSGFENTIIDLAIKISEKIIDREISTNSDVVINQVKKALKEMDTDDSFKIRINAADYEIIESIKSSLVADPKSVSGIEIIIDNNVARGGCKIESSAGMLDANISTQLNKLQRELETI